MKLNLGCGLNKIENFVNVDIDPKVEPDQEWDFRRKFPIEDNSVEHIVFFHVLEHLRKLTHFALFQEMYRVLEPNGELWISFPEFERCVIYWLDNKRGKRDFWEATIYGRQASDFDYHVCALTKESVALLLKDAGFKVYYKGFEPPPNEVNCVIKARKDSTLTYEDLLQREVIDAPILSEVK